MRNALVLLVLAAIAWYAWGTLRKLDDAKVRAFYTVAQAAIDANDADTLCAMMAPDYVSERSGTLSGRDVGGRMDRDTACGNLRAVMALQAKTGMRLSTATQIDSITLSPDRREATVATRERTRGANGMVVASRSTDTLVRDWRGRVQVSHNVSTLRAFRE